MIDYGICIYNISSGKLKFENILGLNRLRLDGIVEVIVVE